jgi:hypothetical protein
MVCLGIVLLPNNDTNIDELGEKIAEGNTRPDVDLGEQIGREAQGPTQDRIARFKEILAQAGKGQPPIPGDELPSKPER